MNLKALVGCRENVGKHRDLEGFNYAYSWPENSITRLSLFTFSRFSREPNENLRLKMISGVGIYTGFPGQKVIDVFLANKHTIILMQTSQNRASRTFMDYESISQAMDGICGLYERKLKELNPAIRNITYDIADLYNFIDGLADMSALVFDHSIQAYMPCDRQWIKQRTFQHLKKLAH